MNESRKLQVFLCHASQDKPVVQELHKRLLAEGWIDAWLDDEKLLPGQDWNMEIEKAVESADAVVVCLSRQSVTKEGYLQRELKYVLDIALEKPEGKIFVIPLRLDNTQPPRRLRNWQYADFFPQNDMERGYQKLLSSLKTLAGTVGILFEEIEINETPPLPSFLMESFQKSIRREVGISKIAPGDPNLEMLSWIEMIQRIGEAGGVDSLISKQEEAVVYKIARQLFDKRSYSESIIYWNELYKRHPSDEEYEAYIKLCIAKIKRNQSIFVNTSTQTEVDRVTILERALHSALAVENYDIAYVLSSYGYINFGESAGSHFFDIFHEVKQKYSEQLRKNLEFCRSELQRIGKDKRIIDQAIIIARKLLIIDPNEEIKNEVTELQQIREQLR